MRILWDAKKSKALKANPKRRTSFEEAQVILQDEDRDWGGGLKSYDPEQHYAIGFGLGNACFYELMNGDCYEPKSVSHYISFSLIAIGCNFGYFFVASPLSDRYRKLAVILLLPSALVTSMFLSSWFIAGQYVAYLSAILAVLFVYRERVSNALGSLERKKRS